MTKIKVQFNRPDPSPAMIRKHKNFGSFIERYQRYHTPSGIRYLFKYDIKKLVLVIIIVLLLLILLFSEDGNSKNIEPQAPASIENSF